MKRIFSIIICITLIFGCLCGCGERVKPEDKRMSIITATFTEYDWVMNILGDEAKYSDVKLLVGGGVDVHSYQSTAEDMIAISQCDILFYMGGTSTQWVYDMAMASAHTERITVKFSDVLHDSLIELGGHEGHNHAAEYDEHLWLSLKNAEVCCEIIANALAKKDKEHGDIYRKNAGLYIEKLEKLDEKYRSAADSSKTKTLVFADRFPFAYLARDYGIKYYAAFESCSAESEADFETITTLAKRVDELSVPAVLTIDGSNQKIAQAVVKNVKQATPEILTVNSLQSVTEKQIEKKQISYLSVMEDNLEIISKALGV